MTWLIDSRSRLAGGAVVLFLAVALAYHWSTRDGRAIRNQMSSVGRALTVAPDEGDLGSVTRIATLRKALAPEIRVSASPPQAAAPGVARHAPAEILGRDAVLALVSRWVPPAGGVTVAFENVEVSLAGSSTADVHCTARITARAAVSEEPVVEVVELRVGFTNINGAWLVSSVEALER